MRYLWILLLLVSLAGCSDYVGSYYYSPRPAISDVRGATTQPVVSGLATVAGVRRADDELDIPRSVEIRFRLDNNGPGEVLFDPATLELSSGSLTDFGPAVVRPRGPITLPPLQSAPVIAWFPFPAGRSENDTDLSAMQLRWLVQIGGQPVRQEVRFQRVYPVHYEYYDPYWDYPYWGSPAYGWYGPPPYYYRHYPPPRPPRHR